MAVSWSWGCSAPTHRAHYSLLDEPRRPLPSTVVLLPPQVTMFEVSAGGVLEEVPEWSAEATSALTRALHARAGERRNFQLVDEPLLSDAEQRVVKQHLALYERVATAALVHTRAAPDDWMGSSDLDAWQQKLDHFDYTLGDGLAFLAPRSGAQAALVAVGTCVVPSESRMALGLIAGGLGLSTKQGEAYVAIGLVDLRSGDLLWVNDAGLISQDSIVALSNFRDDDDVRSAIRAVLDVYPGLDQVAALRSSGS